MYPFLRCLIAGVLLAPALARETTHFEQIPFPPALLARMRQTTYHEGCPVPLEDLRLLSLTYRNYSGRVGRGTLIVNRAVVDDVLFIFRKLYESSFAIENMEPVENFDGNDERSMEANNTSAFNCRDVTGKPGRFSNHSWGRAIDINPLTNPMILNGKSLPPQGAVYIDRTKVFTGSILAGSPIVRLFQSRGWTWGGEWQNPDYQHFEKPDSSRD